MPLTAPAPLPLPPQLLAGALDWGGARATETFWRENAGRFEEGNCQLVRVLVKLLEVRWRTPPITARTHVGAWRP